MPLSSGTRLGPYEILAQIGAGGMGEVYRAHDPRMGRDVAIKVSTERFSDRFSREVHAVAALNHPNICHLYDVGPDYLVMELVDGTPIATPETQRKLLDMVLQIADGLSAAHAAGIVHRDLKPANILVAGAQSRDPGRVKILDFGLAKSSRNAADAPEATRTMDITEPGMAVGTVVYMSPEQARGIADLTPQSDQFSLGLLLYELCSGKRAFVRGSAAETMTAIIREDAEPLDASVPTPLRWVIERLLSKDPAERYDTTRDLYRELRQIRDRFAESISAQHIPATNAEPRRKSRRVLPVVGLATACLFAGGAFTAWLMSPRPVDQSSYKFTPIARNGAQSRFPAWSPDGKSIAYAVSVHGIFQVFVKAIDSATATQLTHARASCVVLSWSPDGTTIYYHSDGGLWAIGSAGGTPERILDNSQSWALHPGGKTVAFVRDGKLWIGGLTGGPSREFRHSSHLGSVRFSPDGSSLAIEDAGDLWILPYPSGTPRNFGAIGYGASWFPDGRHLVASAVSADALEVLDAEDSTRRTLYRANDSILDPAISPDGERIAYAGGETEWDVLEIAIPDGRVRTVIGGGGGASFPDWAPSGTHFLVNISGKGPGLDGVEDRSTTDGFARRVAEAPLGSKVDVHSARWAPDGTRFAFVSESAMGKSQLMIASASGGRPTLLADVTGTRLYAHTWSPDGKWIAFEGLEAGKQKLFKVRAVAGSTREVLTNASPAIRDYEEIQWSPRGDRILYSDAGGMSMISPDGNSVHKLTERKLMAYGFSRDGAQVFGVVQNTTGEGAQWELYSIDVKTSVEKMLAPLELPASTDGVFSFSLHPDGKRFLTSIARWSFDIWMLEGFERPRTRTFLESPRRR